MDIVSRFLRPFIPSWKFFEDIGDEPEIHFRVFRNQRWALWQPAFEVPPRRWRNLFLNPRVNYLLAAGSVIQHLIQEIEEIQAYSEEKPDIEKSVPFEIIQKVVISEIDRRKIAEAERFQFKISSGSEDFLISAEYSLR